LTPFCYLLLSAQWPSESTPERRPARDQAVFRLASRRDSFGAPEAASFWKRGSFRSGSKEETGLISLLQLGARLACAERRTASDSMIRDAKLQLKLPRIALRRCNCSR